MLPSRQTTSNMGMMPGGDSGGGGLDRRGLSQALGGYFTGLDEGEQARQSRAQSAQNAQANFHRSRRYDQQNMGQNAMPFVGPQNTVAPYANLALKRALIGGLGSGQDMNPGGKVGPHIPKTSLPVDFEALKGVANQYLSDDVLMNAAGQYQQNLAQLNPSAPPMDIRSMFGPGADPLMQQIDATRQQGQQFYNDALTQEQDVLMQALMDAQKKPSIISQILGGAATVAPFLI